MEFTRTITVDGDQREEGKTPEADARGVSARLAEARKSNPDLTVDDMGTEKFKLRKSDDKNAMIDAVRGEAAKLAQFTVTERPGEVTKNPVEDKKNELTTEQAWFGEFKTRFDAIPQLHKGVQWTDVEKSLQAAPESMRKLQVLDAAGFEMNVFRAKNSGEIQFRTAQTDVTKIASAYRTIMYDKQAETDYPQYKTNGNAVDLAAKTFGCELADKELYEQLRVQKGWVWLKTDRATRDTGSAFTGHYHGVNRGDAYNHGDNGSFCAALRVKKVS